MAENDYKINSGVIQPPPPSIASDSEFNAGTSTTASPTVKQCKEKLVTTDTNQTITGFKVFNNGSGNNRTNIDIVTDDGAGNDAYTKWAGSIQFKKGNENVGFFESLKDANNSSISQMTAYNKVNGKPVYGLVQTIATSNGTAYATAPDTPADAPANAITTVNYVKNNFVDRTSTQTISGSKRFTQPSSGMSIDLVADTNQQTVPAVSTYRQIGLYRNTTYTKGDGYTSWIQGARESDGWTATELYTRRFLENDSQEIINYLKVDITPDGTPVSYTRTPPAFCVGEEITTAEWFNSKMQVVSALPVNPDPNVFYFIPEQ